MAARRKQKGIGYMAIIAKSDKMFELVDEDAVVERIATGFAFTEGPIWNPVENCWGLPGNRN